jgi:hypothetical protein
MLGWARCGFDKKHVGARYAELVFLHPVRSVGNVVHSIASRESKVDTLFFMLGWHWYGFNKKCTWTRYANSMFLHLVVFAGHVVHSDA